MSFIEPIIAAGAAALSSAAAPAAATTAATTAATAAPTVASTVAAATPTIASVGGSAASAVAGAAPVATAAAQAAGGASWLKTAVDVAQIASAGAGLYAATKPMKTPGKVPVPNADEMANRRASAESLRLAAGGRNATRLSGSAAPGLPAKPRATLTGLG